ncbi:MAG: hypothetical protein QM784_28765 [Polyangiaceae bacterium]
MAYDAPGAELGGGASVVASMLDHDELTESLSGRYGEYHDHA